MTTKNTPPAKTPSETVSAPEQKHHEETPFEAAASICSVLVVGLFILTFLAQNFVIPSGSMEQTLLVGDHLVVDRITLAPADEVDAAGSLSRAEARRHRCVHQARELDPSRRRADDFVSGKAVDRSSR